MISHPVLVGFYSDKETIIQTDACKDELGCCLLQDNKSVYFASRIMTDSVCNYSQIEGEFLGIVFATQKFYNYIYGSNLIILTDHKPLTSIMRKNIHKIASSRLQRLKIGLPK